VLVVVASMSSWSLRDRGTAVGAEAAAEGTPVAGERVSAGWTLGVHGNNQPDHRRRRRNARGTARRSVRPARLPALRTGAPGLSPRVLDGFPTGRSTARGSLSRVPRRSSISRIRCHAVR
jgi:hypothetical protein